MKEDLEKLYSAGSLVKGARGASNNWENGPTQARNAPMRTHLEGSLLERCRFVLNRELAGIQPTSYPQVSAKSTVHSA